MSDVRHLLSQRDRVELLCWLTCGSLSAWYLNETCPTPSFHVEAAHKWLDRHGRINRRGARPIAAGVNQSIQTGT